MSTSVETMSEEEFEMEKSEQKEEDSSIECEDNEYFQADMSTPPRFRTSHIYLEQSDIESDIESATLDEGNVDENGKEYLQNWEVLHYRQALSYLHEGGHL